MNPRTDLPQLPELQASWRSFLQTYESLRPDLYRYCRHLTRSPWDAEDLTQDTLARGFVTLAQNGAPPPNPRAWLFRVASNLWIDRLRRHEPPFAESAPVSSDPRATREAAGTLLSQLSPQERAAVVLKDAFDLGVDEIAEALATTPGAIKAALHRGRGKLAEPTPEQPVAPAPGVLDAFCKAFDAGDLEALTALLLDTASVQVVGATVQYGPEAARRTVLTGMLFGVKVMVNGAFGPERFAGVLDSPPRVSLHAYRGSWVLLHWYQHQDGEAVRALTRLEPDAGGAGDRIAALYNYFYNPELLTEVCAELGVPSRTNGHLWWSTEAG